MKTKSLYSILIILFNLQFSNAATVTWNGGFGYWGQASRWSTGTVPTALDDVIVTGGFVLVPNGMNAQAKSLRVSNTGIFRINYNGSLTMGNQNNIYLIENHGLFFHFGTINMSNVTGSDHWISGGIKNYNLFRTFSGSWINMEAVSHKAIYNETTGNFINNGQIWIDQIYDTFVTGINNFGTFLNDQVGFINVDDGIYGVYNYSDAEIFRNKGKIHINNTAGATLLNYSKLKNFEYGTINVWDRGIMNHDNFENFGLINVLQDSDPFNSPWALYNIDYFLNEGRINLDNSADEGIYNKQDGTNPEFDNKNELIIINQVNHSINNQGLIRNHDAGYVYADNKIVDGELVNNGIFISTSTTKHDFELLNTGAFNDRYQKLNSNATYNQQLIVNPIKGPLENGVPYNDILNLVSDSNVSFGDWVTDEANPLIAGNYVPNTFFPNGLAVGDNLLFVEVTINSSGLTKFLGLVVHSTNFRKSPNIEDTIKTRLNNNTQGLVAYPNPCRSRLFLKHDENANGCIEIFDHQGKLVYSQRTKENISTIQIPENLSSGSYTIRLVAKDKLIATEKIQVIK